MSRYDKMMAEESTRAHSSTPRCMVCDEPESLCSCATSGATALALKLTERGRDEDGRKVTIHADDFLTLCQRAYAWANDASNRALSETAKPDDARDAARYRFLQRTSCGNAEGGKGSDEECYLSLNPRDMDAAIDSHLLDEAKRG